MRTLGEAGHGGPEGAGDGIVGAEVEEGDLAEAESGPAADGVSFGGADEHDGAEVDGGRSGVWKSRF